MVFFNDILYCFIYYDIKIGLCRDDKLLMEMGMETLLTFLVTIMSTKLLCKLELREKNIVARDDMKYLDYHANRLHKTYYPLSCY